MTVEQWTRFLGRLLLLLALLGEQDRVDVGQNTTRGNGDSAQQLGQLLIIADGKLDVAGDDAVLLVVTGSVSSQLKDLSCNVLEDSSQVDRGASSNAVSVLALLQVAGDTAHRELKAGLGRARGGLLATCGLATASSGCGFSCHLIGRGLRGREIESVCVEAVAGGFIVFEPARGRINSPRQLEPPILPIASPDYKTHLPP